MSILFQVLVRIASYGQQIDQSHGENRLSHVINLFYLQPVRVVQIVKRGAKRRVEGKERGRRKKEEERKVPSPCLPTLPPCYFFPYSLYFAPSRLSKNLEQANHERVTFSVRNDTAKS